MLIREEPQSHVHTTLVPHPVSPADTVYATTWGCFPSRQRSHINTMRARSAIVTRRYAWRENETGGGGGGSGGGGGGRSNNNIRPASALERPIETARSMNGVRNSSQGRPMSSSVYLEQIHRAKMGELPFVAACRRYPLSPQRPASAAVPKAVVSRLTTEQTASSRARSAGSGGHEVRGRAGGHGGYSWVTLSLFTDSKRAVYDSHGSLRGSKRTGVK